MLYLTERMIDLPAFNNITRSQLQKALDNSSNDAELLEQLNKATKPKKNNLSKLNSSAVASTATNEEISQIIRNNLYWTKYKPVKPDAQEISDRLQEFFSHIADTGELPTVEKMCLALGHPRNTIFDWENGDHGREVANVIKIGKNIMAGLDAELVQKNKIPAITYIFRSKNYYGLRDEQKIVLEPKKQMDDVDAVDIAKRLPTAVQLEQGED